MENAILTVSGICKKYGGKDALRDVTLQIPRGSLYGLIGRNGAGKTTLMKIISGQIRASSGEIRCEGSVKMGALVEAPALYPDRTALENLMYKLIAMGVKQPRTRAEDLLRLVELHKTGGKKAGKFSLGMKQRLGMALAMAGEPDLVLLDEPINGMDPQGIASIRNMLIHLHEKGVTVLISSHILDELAKFATHFAIVKDGRLIDAFTREQMENSVRLTIETDDAPGALRVLRDVCGLAPVEKDGRILVYSGVEDYRRVSRALFDAGVYLAQFRADGRSLESYFIDLTGGETA